MGKSRGTTIKVSGPGCAEVLAALMKPKAEPIDLVEMANGIAESIGKVTTPLTDEQRSFLAAALGPWIERAQNSRD